MKQTEVVAVIVAMLFQRVLLTTNHVLCGVHSFTSNDCR